MQNAQLVPERKIFQLKGGSSFEDGQLAGEQCDQHALRCDTELMENAQVLSSQIVRDLREAQALEMGDSIYVGAFQGDRLAKIGYKK